MRICVKLLPKLNRFGLCSTNKKNEQFQGSFGLMVCKVTTLTFHKWSFQLLKTGSWPLEWESTPNVWVCKRGPHFNSSVSLCFIENSLNTLHQWEQVSQAVFSTLYNLIPGLLLIIQLSTLCFSNMNFPTKSLQFYQNKDCCERNETGSKSCY